MRGVKLIVFSAAEGVHTAARSGGAYGDLSRMDPFVAPILYAVPGQKLAYQVALLRRADVDQPRGLAKSTTVKQGADRTWLASDQSTT